MTTTRGARVGFGGAAAWLCFFSVAVAWAGGETPGRTADSPSALVHVQAAKALARNDITAPLFLCSPDAMSIVKHAIETGGTQWVDPTRAFDDLDYVGNEFTGVWVLRTKAGLILFDATGSADDVQRHLVPGLVKLGLEPSAIRYVVVTHGHWDHVGGAAYLQQTYGATVALGGADWDLIEKTRETPTGPRPIPRRDLVVVDGQRITLGDTAVTLYLTPGHTPGTISAVVPVHEAGHTYALALFGGINLPATLDPDARSGGLRQYDESVRRFAETVRRAGAVGIMSTQVFAEGGVARLSNARTRRPGQPNPFLIGSDATSRYFGLLDECAKASEARLQAP